MNSPKCGFLQSSHIAAAVDKKAVARSIRMLTSCYNRCVELVPINADQLDQTVLQDCDVVINPLGACYPEDGWRHLLRYYREGGMIISIGLKPFTIPYTIRNNTLEVHPETASAIHSTYVIDEYQLTGAVDSARYSARVLHPRYDFLRELIDSGSLPEMKETCSIFYHLAEKSLRDDSIPMAFVFEENLPDSQVEVALGFYDLHGRMKAAPITRIDHYSKGSFIFLNYSPSDDGYYSTDAGIKLLAGILKSALRPAARIVVRPDYPRYNVNETVTTQLGYSLLKPDLYAETSGMEFIVSLEQIQEDEKVIIDQMTIVDPELTDGTFRTQKTFSGLEEGDYIVTASLVNEGTVVARFSNGFLKLSEQAVADRLNKFKRISLDSTIAPDFCVQDGKPFAMHGTTYFVTDKFRNFLFDFNPVQCDADLKRLSAMGFNIIRSGNWHNVLRLFDDEGNIQEYSLRALESLFLTAAKYDLPVQFVFAAYIFNPWDRNKCPIHNPEMRKKTLQAVSSFAGRFKGWPNVMVDVINEPSYSLSGLWQPVRPSGDAWELRNYRQWLREKYNNDISRLRVCWNADSHSVETFDDIQIPKPEMFERGYDTKPTAYYDYAQLSDFYTFARDTYSSWVKDMRDEVKSRDPDMLFMMGRDEPLRIPVQQLEAYQKNYDLINWHQWHADSIIFVEYALNRVRNLPCCGQELGVYYYSDQRNNLRFNTEEIGNMLERKLCYSFGNWIQWQSVCDPFMVTNVEIFLGLLRYDGTETRHMDKVRLLSWIEQKTAHLMAGRNEDANRILTVHPAYQWFSCDSSLAKRAVYRSIVALHYGLNMQSDYVMEDLLNGNNTMQIGTPELIIMPGFLMLSETAWEYILRYMLEGGTVLFTGDANVDEYWNKRDRLSEFGLKTEPVTLNTVERITINGRTYCASFRDCVGLMHPGTVLNRTAFADHTDHAPVTIPVGKGKMIYSPLPLELCDPIEPLAELYRYAIQEAGISNQLCRVIETIPQSNLMIYPIEYSGHVLYTIVNEGCDDVVHFRDIISGCNVELEIPAQRGAKLWIGKNGSLLGAYINGRLKVGETIIIAPHGDLALYNNRGVFELFFGERIEGFAEINGDLFYPS